MLCLFLVIVSFEVLVLYEICSNVILRNHTSVATFSFAAVLKLFKLHDRLNIKNFKAILLVCVCGGGGGGAVAQSTERATPGEEVVGSIPAVASCSLLVRSVLI